MGASDRVEDARFLWARGRLGSGLLLACVTVAARARREDPELTDRQAFERLLRDAQSPRISVEYRARQWPIEKLLYKWVRCELIHNAAVPLDIEIDADLGDGLAVRAGGAPHYLLKLSPGWFDFLISVASGEDASS